MISSLNSKRRPEVMKPAVKGTTTTRKGKRMDTTARLLVKTAETVSVCSSWQVGVCVVGEGGEALLTIIITDALI